MTNKDYINLAKKKTGKFFRKKPGEKNVYKKRKDNNKIYLKRK